MQFTHQTRCKNCTVTESAVQPVAIEHFTQLQENDILFIDSSHIVKTGSGVAHIIFNILPQLNKGVIIHFHDILWPFEYPKSWMMQGVSWNEAYFLQSFLQYNESFETLYFNSYLAECHPEELKQHIIRDLAYSGGSLWLRKIT